MAKISQEALDYLTGALGCAQNAAECARQAQVWAKNAQVAADRALELLAVDASAEEGVGSKT